MNIHETIKQHIHNNKKVVIGIDGRSCSGKTTFALQLKETYHATLFHMDDYFLSEEEKTEERLSNPGGNVDYERFLEEVLSKINHDKVVTKSFNCQTQSFEKEKVIPLSNIIIVEGAYSLHPELDKYYTLKLFFTTDYEHQLKRIKARNGEKLLQRFIQDWIPLEEVYIEKTKLINRVDYIHKT